MDTYLYYIPIVISGLFLFLILYRPVGEDFDLGKSFSLSVVFIGVLSIFIFFSDSWTYKRWFNRLYFPSYFQTNSCNQYIVKNLYSGIKVSNVLNVVIIKWKIINEDIRGKKLREFERNINDFGGGEKYKLNLIEDLIKNDTIIDYLQQGIELHFITTDNYKTLFKTIITYEDIINYKKHKSEKDK